MTSEPSVTMLASDEQTPNAAVAEAAGLIYVHDDDPGVTRVKAGAGFDYLDPKGRPVTQAKTLDRIRALAVPPAYNDVWICSSPRGHIQATGRDERGRKQYRYHDLWAAARAQTKFARMAAFGRALPTLRQKIDHDLKTHGLARDKVLATVVSLLETTMIRVGNDEYAKTNKSFGLTTLAQAAIVTLKGAGAVTFEFKRQERGRSIKTKASMTARLARVLRGRCEEPAAVSACSNTSTHDGRAARHRAATTSMPTCARPRARTSPPRTFRTWMGTLAGRPGAGPSAHAPTTERVAGQEVHRPCAVKATAWPVCSRNTPAVCRSAYIHPGVVRAFIDKRLPEAFAALEGEAFETEVLEFLDALAEEVEAETGQSPKVQLRASRP